MRHDCIFAYGSLLNPDSLRRTLPDLDVATCVPARARGFVRTWTVAFPNDGSQSDKSFRDANGAMPEVVLFANLERASASSARGADANGVLIPMALDRVERLANRERRYRLEDVSTAIEVYDDFKSEVSGSEMHVATFVGRPEFTRGEDVAQGVIRREYRESILHGVAYWDERVEGFKKDFDASTVIGPHIPIVRLARADHVCS